MIKSWRDIWEDVEPILQFPIELRKIVYTTNATRVAEYPVPLSRRAPRAFAHRPGSREGTLPRRYRAAEESDESDREDLRMESYPERPIHPLPRPHQCGHHPNMTRPGSHRDLQSRSRVWNASLWGSAA